MENVYNNPVDQNSRVPKLPKNYRPTPDEIKLLNECKSERNVNGAIGAIISGGLTYQSIKLFGLKLHSRFGIYPTVGLWSAIGYVLGAISTIPSCKEKFKHQPDSLIGAALRGNLTVSPTSETITESNLNFTDITLSQQSNNAQMNHAIDIDVYNTPSDMDSYTGTELNDTTDDNLLDENDIRKPVVSYAELRSRNREGSLKANKEKYNPVSSIANDSRVEPPTQRSSPPPIRYKETNEYGDVWG
ncbi:OCIA domain-containing protein 1-like isoform X2 [Diprion similis]|uniref:OCIA domain-containing protein 1-like isoform X2 n=1 Tax=Diprion similis TaxID=362088 RepID=UPI001EF95B69|nr:OCIA domain-containing protein 1-like isoform X2 [Diprion similis]